MPSRMSRAWRLSGTRGSPSAPSRMASKSSRSIVERVLGQRDARLQVVVGAPVEATAGRCRAPDAVGRRAQHLHRLGRHVHADAVAGNDRDAQVAAAHGSRLAARGERRAQARKSAAPRTAPPRSFTTSATVGHAPRHERLVPLVGDAVQRGQAAAAITTRSGAARIPPAERAADQRPTGRRSRSPCDVQSGTLPAPARHLRSRRATKISAIQAATGPQSPRSRSARPHASSGRGT